MSRWMSSREMLHLGGFASSLKRSYADTGRGLGLDRKRCDLSGGLRLAAIVAAVALAVGLSVPHAALAQEGEAGSEEKMFQSATYMKGELQPKFPDTMEQGGKTWQLVEVGQPQPDKSFTPEVREFIHQEAGTFTTEDEARQAFPSSWPNEDPAFPGDLGLAEVAVEPIFGQAAVVEDEIRTFGPCASNDVLQAPSSIQKTVQDARGTRTEEWPLAFAEWEVSSTNAIGMPTAYMLEATYRGAVVHQKVIGYEATALYKGSLPRAEERLVVEATYVALPEAAEEKQPAGNVAAPVVGGTAAAVVAIGAVWFLRSRNVVVCSRTEERVLAKVHAARGKTSLKVKLPAWVNCKDGLVLQLRPQLCSEMPLEVWQAGVKLYEGPALERLELDGNSPVGREENTAAE